MLDIMRRKKRLKAVLWVVIVSLGMGMLLLFVPGQNIGGGGSENVVATVDGDPISVKEFYNAYRRMIENYTSGSRGNIDPEILRSLGIERQALTALINVRVVSYAAKRLGLEVTPEEISRAIEGNPNLQEGGVFIGVERYKALLAANRIEVEEFEQGIRQMLLARKLSAIISDSLEVTESQLREEFARTTQEARIRYVLLNREDFKKRVNTADSELRAYFEANTQKYFTKEERRAEYLLVSISGIVPTVQVTDQEIIEEWNREQKGELVEASHILFAVNDPSTEAQVRAKAEAVLNRIRAGEDFAELARVNSEDPGSAQQGGYLGSFPRGQMVREFEDAAFSLPPGQVSGLVKTQYGFHIIKVLKRESPSLEANRESVERTVRYNKATAIAQSKAKEAEETMVKEAGLAAVAAKLGVPAEVKDTGLLTRTSDPYEAGISQPLLDEIFSLQEVKSVGKSIQIPSGYAVPQLAEVRLPRAPEFSAVREAVEKDFVASKSEELMKAEAARLSDEAAKTGDLEKTARAAGFQPKSSDPFKRAGSPSSDIPHTPALNAEVFRLSVGSVSPPIAVAGGEQTAVIQLLSLTPFDEAEFSQERQETRQSLLLRWREAYFEEYIKRMTDNLEKAGKIRINNRVIERVVGIGS